MMSADRRYFCVIGNSLEFSITQKGTFFFKFILKSASQLNSKIYANIGRDHFGIKGKDDFFVIVIDFLKRE